MRRQERRGDKKIVGPKYLRRGCGPWSEDNKWGRCWCNKEIVLDDFIQDCLNLHEPWVYTRLAEEARGGRLAVMRERVEEGEREPRARARERLLGTVLAKLGFQGLHPVLGRQNRGGWHSWRGWRGQAAVTNLVQENTDIFSFCSVSVDRVH
jgi:hypothetical protein